MSEPIYEHHINGPHIRYLGSTPVSGFVYDLYVDLRDPEKISYHARYSSGDTGSYNWTETMVLGINDGSHASHTIALREAMRRHRAAPGDAPKPRYTHHEHSTRSTFLGHFAEDGKNYDLYVYEPDTSTTYYTARWGSNSNQYWTKFAKAVQEPGILPHRAALTAAMMRHKEKMKGDLLLPHQKRIVERLKTQLDTDGPRWPHPVVNERETAFLGRHADTSGDYDLYVHKFNGDRGYDILAARFGLSTNACAAFYRYAVQSDTRDKHITAVREAMRRSDLSEKKDGDMRPKYKHHSSAHTYLGTTVAACRDYDLYAYENGDRYVYVRWGDGDGAYQCLAVGRVEEMNVTGDKSAWTLREIFREAVKRYDLMEKATPMMTLFIDEHGRTLSGGHNVQSIPKDKLRDLSSEEPLFIDDKLQGAFDKKNRSLLTTCDMAYAEMQVLASLGVPAEYLNAPTSPSAPGSFPIRGRYEVPIHAFGLTVDHPGFQRPAAPAKKAEQEVRPNSLFGSDIKEAHTKQSDDRRERFKRALRHCFPPSMPFGPDSDDTCSAAVGRAAAELKLTSEAQFRMDNGREGRKHSFEWNFMDRMGRPEFGFQVRFWAEAPTKEEAWKTLEAGVMAFAGPE